MSNQSKQCTTFEICHSFTQVYFVLYCFIQIRYNRDLLSKNNRALSLSGRNASLCRLPRHLWGSSECLGSWVGCRPRAPDIPDDNKRHYEMQQPVLNVGLECCTDNLLSLVVVKINFVLLLGCVVLNELPALRLHL